MADPIPALRNTPAPAPQVVPPPPAPPPAAPVRPAAHPEVSTTSRVQTTLLARATSGRTVTPPTTIVRSDKDLQDALDTFMDYSTERYRVLGTEVDVKVGFRMTPPGNLREKDKMTAKADAELSAAARALKMDRAVVGLLVSGRATPGQIHLITQQLL